MSKRLHKITSKLLSADKKKLSLGLEEIAGLFRFFFEKSEYIALKLGVYQHILTIPILL
jgi:hypothetical protein